MPQCNSLLAAIGPGFDTLHSIRERISENVSEKGRAKVNLSDDRIAQNFLRVLAVTRDHWQAETAKQRNAAKALSCNRTLPRRFGLVLAHATSYGLTATNA
jgi:flagellar biosynthesis chaperone FliJ